MSSLFSFFSFSFLLLHFFISSFSRLFPLSQAASVATLPSALFVERLSLGASWVYLIQWCCDLIIDLGSPFEGNWSRHWRSHLISAVELGCLDTISLLSLFPLCSFFFFSAFLSFPQRNFEPGSPRNDDRQLRRPLASPFLWGILHSRPRRASPSGYCAEVRTPLHSPTTDAAVPLAFSPLQQRLAS